MTTSLPFGMSQYVAAKPVSRILSAGLLRQDGHSSGPRIAARLKRPTRRFDAPSQHVLRRTRGPSLFGLAPCGVCPARHITAAAVRSYRTFSPLPGTRSKAGFRRYVFCGTFRRVDLNPPSRTLSGTLLCGVRTFLPRRWTQRERPSGPAANTSLYSLLRTGPRTSAFRPRTADHGHQKSDLGLRSGNLLLD